MGTPPDDPTAIGELERLRRSVASFMVFAWPAFWWLESCTSLREHRRSKFRCVLENERLVAFDLSRETEAHSCGVYLSQYQLEIAPAQKGIGRVRSIIPKRSRFLEHTAKTDNRRRTVADAEGAW